MAWLTDTAQTGPTEFQLGDVEFTWGGAVSQDLVVPGENIVATDYTLVNTSTIRTELRFKIEIYSDYLDGDGSDYVILTIDDGWVLETDGFITIAGATPLSRKTNIRSCLRRRRLP